MSSLLAKSFAVLAIALIPACGDDGTDVEFTVTPPAGTYTTPQMVTLKVSPTDAKLRYALTKVGDKEWEYAHVDNGAVLEIPETYQLRVQATYTDKPGIFESLYLEEKPSEKTYDDAFNYVINPDAAAALNDIDL